tara:strand:+ start:816 stop:1130 length:315 start_codon:yes stop_codon:yes gene_type:complete
MEDTTKINLISKALMFLTFLGIYSTSIWVFKMPSSPMVLVVATIALICAYFIIKLAVMELIKIFLKMFEQELIESLRDDGDEEKLINRIIFAQKEIRKKMPTIH